MLLSHFARRARFVIALLLFVCAFIFANQLADDQNAAGSHNIIWAVASFMSTVQGALMLRADWLENSLRAEALAALEPVDDPAAAARVSLTKNDAKGGLK